MIFVKKYIMTSSHVIYVLIKVEILILQSSMSVMYIFRND